MAKSKPGARGLDDDNISEEAQRAYDRSAAGIRSRLTSAERARQQDEDEERSQIFNVLREQIGTGGFVHLARKRASDVKAATIEPKIPIDQFSEEWVMDTFGGGDFIATFKLSTGEIVKPVHFTIDHTLGYKHPRATVPGTGLPAVGGGNQDIAAIVQAVMQKQGGDAGLMPLVIAMMQSNTQIVTAALANKGGGGGDDLIKSLLPLALRKAEPPDLLSFYHTIEKIKKGDMTPLPHDDDDPPEQKSVTERVVEMLAPMLPDLIGAVISKMGGGDNSASAPRVVQPVAPPRSVAPAGSAENGAHPAAAAGSAGNGAEQPRAAAVTVETPNESDPMFLASAKNMIRNAALRASKAKQDPFAFVNGIANFVPEAMWPKVFEFANQPDWLKQMIAADAEAANHVTFLQDVRNAVLYLKLCRDAMVAIAGGVAADAMAKSFAAWANAEFRDMAKEDLQDAEWFADTFGDSYDAHKAWIDALRSALLRELAPAAPATTNETGAPKSRIPKPAAAAAKKV